MKGQAMQRQGSRGSWIVVVMLLAACQGNGVEPTTDGAATSSSMRTTTSAPPVTGKAAEHSPAGAAAVVEEYLHAIGTKDWTTACRISAPVRPTWTLEECRRAFGKVMRRHTRADLVALRAARVNVAKMRIEGPDKVWVDKEAIHPFPPAEQDRFAAFLLEWRDDTWLITG